MKELVFTYGTLMAGGSNHHVMETAEGVFIGRGVTRDSSYDMTSLSAFPGMLDWGSYSIIGEVYEVSNITPIDRLEGHPSFYERKQIPILVPGVWVRKRDKKRLNREIICWAYFIPHMKDGELCPINNHNIIDITTKEWRL